MVGDEIQLPYGLRDGALSHVSEVESGEKMRLDLSGLWRTAHRQEG